MKGLIIMLFVSTLGYGQGPAGFYAVIANKKNCANLVNAYSGAKSFCLATDPLILSSEFESVSEITYDSTLRLKVMTLTLTERGFRQLKFLTEKLPESELALVLENHVAGIFDDVGKNLGRTIAIKGGINTDEVEWVQEQLKKKK